jgi:hypothetical protein
MDNRPDENGLVNNHIPKSGFFKTDLDSVMNLGLLTGYFAHPYKLHVLHIIKQRINIIFIPVLLG